MHGVNIDGFVALSVSHQAFDEFFTTEAQRTRRLTENSKDYVGVRFTPSCPLCSVPVW